MKRVALAVLFGTAAVCYAINLRTPPAWLFAVCAAVSIFWSTSSLPTVASQWANRVLYLGLAGTAVLGWILVVYPFLSAQAIDTWSLVLGYPLGLSGCVFILTRRRVSSVVLAAAGILVVTGFDLNTVTHQFLAVAGTAGFAYLAADVAPWRGDRAVARLLIVGAFGVGCAAIAIFVVLILPWTQGVVEETMMTVYTPIGDGLDGQHQTRLGDLRQLKLSKKIVMRVWGERPQKLRSRVFVRFDGSRWHRDPASLRMLAPSGRPSIREVEQEFLESLPGADFVPVPERLERQRLIRTRVIRVDGGGLATPGGTRVVHAPLQRVRIDAAAVTLPPPGERVRLYAVLHEVNHQRTQDGPLSEPERESALQLPDRLDARVEELARTITADAPTAEAAVERVVAHLRESYEYSLDVGNINRQDPLADFLFERRRGWCEYFAGAAAVLLRTQGIPTRYVEGFNVIGSQRKDDYYLVREWDRHAWFEAYIEGKGWLEYDPTPAAELESLHAGLESGMVADVMEWIRLQFASLYVQLRHFEWSRTPAAVLWVLAAVFAIHAGVRLLRRRRWEKETRPAKPSVPSTGLEVLVEELDRRGAELGFPRPKSEPPLEYWSGVPNEVPNELREAGLRIVECFYRARFGGTRLSEETIRNLESELSSLEMKGGM